MERGQPVNLGIAGPVAHTCALAHPCCITQPSHLQLLVRRQAADEPTARCCQPQ